MPRPQSLRGQSVGDALCDLLIEEQLDIDAIFFCMSEDNLRTILRQNWVMVGSDAAVRDTDGMLGRDMPHPRAFGTCARFLEMVRDEKLMPLEEAVSKMTSMPAARMGFRDRGLLAQGYRADLVLFDPHAVRDTATYASAASVPRRRARRDGQRRLGGQGRGLHRQTAGQAFEKRLICLFPRGTVCSCSSVSSASAIRCRFERAAVQREPGAAACILTTTA